MSTIRPLVTIAILIGVGAFLYVKINEGTVTPPPHAGESEHHHHHDHDIPPLATTDPAPATTNSAAPSWPATADAPPVNDPSAAAPPATTTVAAPSVTPPGTAAPAVPPIPEIPEIGTTTQAAPHGATSPAAAPPPVETTTDTRYPEALPVAVPVATPDAGVLPPSTAIAAQEATTPEQMNEAGGAAAGVSTTPLAAEPNPLRQATQPVETPDRYNATATNELFAADPAPQKAPTEPATTTSAGSFVDSWPAIQAMLDRGELSEAHKQLSRWYNDPSLTPTDAERVDILLSQLAGTVVYSTEHHFAPARVVKQGETLDTIAAEYNVPSQLLAKINGIPAPYQVQPGQELKVVKGPFSAFVDLSRSQLTLIVDDRYAGRFPVKVTPGQAIGDGDWTVGKKSNEQAPGRALLLQGRAATPGEPAPGTPAPTLIIADEVLATNPANGTMITVSAQDAQELTDILSIGSRVVTRR